MFIEKLVLENFKCFGPGRTTIRLDSGMTAFIGANGAGKTAACEALLRLFGITTQERTVRVDDFHVPLREHAAVENTTAEHAVAEAPAAEQSAGEARTDKRELTIEAVLAFPELEEESEPEAGGADGMGEEDEGESPAQVAVARAVPEFFRRMVASQDGELKVRVVLKAEWVDDGTVDGTITEERVVVNTLADEYGDADYAPLTPAERSRIQMIYIPASRDGVRQVANFLRGRLWRAAQWSNRLHDAVRGNAADVARTFTDEPVVKAVETALSARWQELHGGGTHANPRLQLLDDDFDQLVRNSELIFEPDHGSQPRPARLLSDGQRSLLHLALVSAALDVEAAVVEGRHSGDFTLDTARLPDLTLIAVEEPENSLSPFYLSRIVGQLHALSAGLATQAVLSSHSASVMTRIRPEDVRYFRVEPLTASASVREISLPVSTSEEGKYLREAVYAHPELYFAKFVVLGEGDSEEVVIPRIARAFGIHLDPSFVAVVPFGGRHTNHMWKLLNDLKIPHATLLDLDYGKDGGGPGHLRDVCNQLIANGHDPLQGLDYDTVEAIHDDLDVAAIRSILSHLRTFGIFYATPLDLDYAMLRQFKNAYTHLEPGDRGPRSSDPSNTVLGENGGTRKDFWSNADRIELLRWYRYLFLGRSKPSTHLRALTRLSDEDLKASAPDFLKTLVEHIRCEAGL
ncbi:chromosome segregation protein SMC [Kitasatospora sp. NE20-6]|uniref:ATP-dependent nuclease n=1 Tax=Kitasatospora sp. NE20-6 TaxID=2859066 RepID=UPI0034DC40D3